MTVDANRIRCIDPLVSPQYPFNEPPRPPERSEPRYATFADYEAPGTDVSGFETAGQTNRCDCQSRHKPFQHHPPPEKW